MQVLEMGAQGSSLKLYIQLCKNVVVSATASNWSYL